MAPKVLSQTAQNRRRREEYAQRSEEEKRRDAIRGRCKATIKQAVRVLAETAWELLGRHEQQTVLVAVKAEIRARFQPAVEQDMSGVEYDKLLDAGSVVRFSISKVFMANIHLFRFGGGDDDLPLVSELFDLPDLEARYGLC